MSAILGWGVHLPRLRLERSAIAAAHAWANPALKARGRGRRTFANWDEDAVTMAVAAARRALDSTQGDSAPLAGIALGSTSLPFAERQNAGIVAAALDLPADMRLLDLGGGGLAGLAALTTARDAVLAGGAPWLAIASERPPAKPGSLREIATGDAAAAFVIGADSGQGPGRQRPARARIVATHSHMSDFADHQRASSDRFGQSWEERWVRDELWGSIVPAAIREALAAFGLAGGDIARLALPCPFPKFAAKVARSAGIPGDRIVPDLLDGIGDAGAAHAALLLVRALDAASPGERILAIAVGQGVDVLLIEAGKAIAAAPRPVALDALLAAGTSESNYQKLLRFRDLIPADLGMRGEARIPAPPTVLYRRGDMLTGFVGGRCSACGTVQFPRNRICVSPNCGAIDTQVPHPFAGRDGRVASWSEDHLSASADPPSVYGMVDFDGGGRLMMDFADATPGATRVGQRVRPSFRIREIDPVRGVPRYFWKVVAVTDAAAEGDS